MTTAAPTSLGRPTATATAAAGLAVIFWGIGNAFNKLIDASGVAVAFWRMWVGAPVMIALLYATGGRLSRRTFVRSLEAGVSFGAQVVLFFSALRLTTVANATIIAALQPVLVMFAAWRWMGEQVTRADVVLALGAIGGVALVVGTGATGGESRLSGDVLAVGALVLWAHYFTAIKRARRHLGPFELMAGVITVGAVVVTPYAVLSGADLGGFSRIDWFWLVAIVFVPGAGGHLLSSWSAHHLPVSRSSQFTLGIPVVGLVAAAVLVDEPLLPGQLLGVGVTVALLAVLVGRTVGPGSDVPPRPR